MDCLHFTLPAIATYAQALEKAEKLAQDFFEHLRYDIEMEARQRDVIASWHGQDVDVQSDKWDVEVTVRVWDSDE